MGYCNCDTECPWFHDYDMECEDCPYWEEEGEEE